MPVWLQDTDARCRCDGAVLALPASISVPKLTIIIRASHMLHGGYIRLPSDRRTATSEKRLRVQQTAEAPCFSFPPPTIIHHQSSVKSIIIMHPHDYHNPQSTIIYSGTLHTAQPEATGKGQGATAIHQGARDIFLISQRLASFL